MKNRVDGVLVVEGASDVAYLSTFIDALYFVLNGYDVANKIAFLKEASKVNKLIIFTDSDEAGEKIRNQLKTSIEGVYVALLNGNSRPGYKKKGVAEAKKEDVLEALKEHLSNKEIHRENYELSMRISLHKNAQETRNKIITKYNLVSGSNKSIENQLNILKIKKEEVWKLIETI